MKNLKFRVLLILAVAGLFAWGSWPPSQKIKLGLDLRGGMYLLLKVDDSKLVPSARPEAAQRALEVLRNRIDQFGVSEPVIQLQGGNQILIQLPGITDRQRALDLIGRTALLEFKLVEDDPAKLTAALDGQVPAGFELKERQGDKMLLHSNTAVSGDGLTDAQLSFDSQFNQPMVTLQFNTHGATAFRIVTEANVGKRLAIVLDGVVQTAPVIKQAIPNGQAVIEGSYTQQEAADLAIVLRAGALPAPVVVQEDRTVGPTLGSDSIRQGIRATLLGAGLVFLFMAGYYLLAGVIANVALFLNLVILLGMMSFLDAALTLPGIAGIVLTMGMAVDANVLVNERMREEFRRGRTLFAGVHAGYDKAFLAILDSNVTTLITAAILYYIGTGPVRGFAVTLAIGLVASMFTALFVTRTVFDVLIQNESIRSVRMLQLFKPTKIDFVKYRYPCLALSLVVICVGLFIASQRGSGMMGVDFSGGAVQVYRFEKAATISQIRQALSGAGLDDAVIQEYGNDREIMIRTPQEHQVRIEQALQTASLGKFELLSQDIVGPAVSTRLKSQAFWALFWSLVAMSVYISLRFEFRFAVAAIMALFHDVLAAIGFLALTGRTFNVDVIAALLTIVGFSVNDTIVTFDRLRENMRTTRKVPFKDLVNQSVNETLGRTVLTSLTVLATVLSLYLWGGPVINNFAFTMLVGVISGTYSTVYIATPILLAWSKKKTP